MKKEINDKTEEKKEGSGPFILEGSGTINLLVGFNLDEYLRWVKSWGAHKGKQELIRHLEGETLSRAEAMTAYCFSCGAGYSDGAKDCEMYHCSMYPYMPYGTRKPKTGRSGRVLSDEHKAKMLEGRRAKK